MRRADRTLSSIDIAQQFITDERLGNDIEGLATALATKFSGTVAGLVKQELARCEGKIDGHKRIWEINGYSDYRVEFTTPTPVI